MEGVQRVMNMSLNVLKNDSFPDSNIRTDKTMRLSLIKRHYSVSS